MESRQWKTLDRSRWARGPWDDEPDKVQWQDTATGLPCLIVRHYAHGHLCGYVGVSRSHPLFGADYEAPLVDVHGGLTYASACRADEPEAISICHVAPPGEDDVWWFGFDCAHCGDLSPATVKYAEDEGPTSVWARLTHQETYRTVEYVRAECTSLAAQLGALQ